MLLETPQLIKTTKKMTISKHFNINKRFKEKFKWHESEYNFFF
jgi:hypothetical protein